MGVTPTHWLTSGQSHPCRHVLPFTAPGTRLEPHLSDAVRRRRLLASSKQCAQGIEASIVATDHDIAIEIATLLGPPAPRSRIEDVHGHSSLDFEILMNILAIYHRARAEEVPPVNPHSGGILRSCSLACPTRTHSSLENEWACSHLTSHPLLYPEEVPQGSVTLATYSVPM
ncbi:hypothetical protein K466DRAFT_112814 [Polyporus arcularius HHB13444]|uniref:Uncharacterized protein n=1 Tax=Polyporus arcularius HHB13444 TaxID=1314778 RepID=A0A5C3PFS4_9APHY|nr:hypothetical protein K466DRAFT_112814 [Polyporus arcularius HHB13444]